MSFINPKWQKGVSNVLTDALTRAAGVAGTGFVLEKVFPAPTNANDEKQKTKYNIGGPLMLLGGLALDVFAANPMIRTAAQGMAMKGMERTLKAFVPSVASSIGLGAIESTQETTTTAQNAALMGAAGTVGALPSGLPEEFNSVKESEVKNDGNPWNEVADKIDDPNTTVKVEGVEDATLMGEDLTAEEAELMGMF